MDQTETKAFEITRDSCHLYTLQFGKYAGRRLIDTPLTYVRWLRSEFSDPWKKRRYPRVHLAVTWYLSNWEGRGPDNPSFGSALSTTTIATNGSDCAEGGVV